MTGPRRPMLCDGFGCKPIPGPAPEEWEHEYPCSRGIVESVDKREHTALDGWEPAASYALGISARPHPYEREDTA